MPLRGCCLLPPTVHCVQVWRASERAASRHDAAACKDPPSPRHRAAPLSSVVPSHSRCDACPVQLQHCRAAAWWITCPSPAEPPLLGALQAPSSSPVALYGSCQSQHQMGLHHGQAGQLLSLPSAQPRT